MPRPKPGQEKQAPRPSIKLDWDRIDLYLESGCSGSQVASSIGVCPNTLYTRCESEKGLNFCEYRRSKMETGESDLAAQFHLDALGRSKTKGNASLLLRLGEERLGHGMKSKALNLTVTNLSDLPKHIKDGTLNLLMTQDEVSTPDESISD